MSSKNNRGQRLLRYDVLSGIIIVFLILIATGVIWYYNNRTEIEKRALPFCDSYEKVIICDDIIGLEQTPETYLFVNTKDEQFECPPLAHENMRTECKHLLNMTKAGKACKEQCHPFYFLR